MIRPSGSGLLSARLGSQGERLNSPDGTVRADSVQMIHIGAYSMRYGTRSGVVGRQRETVM